MNVTETRFVPKHLTPELFNLWHLSKVHSHKRYDRLVWTSKHFAAEHGLGQTAVYKDLDAITR